MRLKKQDINFRDSALYLPASLASLPKTFGVAGVKKGDFPHKLNCKKWLDRGVYREKQGNRWLRFPKIEYFEPEKMKEDKLKEFLDWHKAETKRYRENYRLSFDVKRKLFSCFP